MHMYMSAMVFFELPGPAYAEAELVVGMSDDALGIILIIANCACFCLLVGIVWSTLRDSVAAARDVEKSLADRFNISLELTPPVHPCCAE